MNSNNNTSKQSLTLFVVVLVLIASLVSMLALKHESQIPLSPELGEETMNSEATCIYACCKRGADLPPLNYSCPNLR